MLDDIFKAVVAAGAAFFAHPQLTDLQVDVIGNDKKLFFGIHPVIIADLADGFPAQIHIGQGFHQDYFMPFYETFGHQTFTKMLRIVNMISVDQFVDDIETDIVPGTVIFSARITQACDHKKTFHGLSSPALPRLLPGRLSAALFGMYSLLLY
jgi:hypothetical protein